jgi:beta-lactamase superfamily II metal-dependent hydrolase
LLLTGDAHGKDVVTAWKELELGTDSVKIDLLKMPHHGSVRNVTEDFLKFAYKASRQASKGGKAQPGH